MKRTRQALRLCAPMLLVSVVACDHADTRSVLTTSHDSAGIRIVTSEELGSGLNSWSISDAPSVSIGVIDGDSAYQFFRIGGVARLSDDRIVVANSGTNELRIYLPSGAHEQTLGGPGEGPGEYRGMRYLWRLDGDSILVEDGLNSRLSLYASDGTLVRTWSLRELRPFDTPPPVGRFGDGRWVVRTARSIGEPPEPVEFVGLLVAYSSDSPADTIAEIPGGPAYFEQVGPNMRRLPAPFATTSHVVMSDDRVFAGNGATFQIRVLDSEGNLEEIWRLGAPERPVTAADIAADKAVLLERMRTDDRRRDLERVYALVPIPGQMPAYSRLLIDDLEWVWVEEYHAAGDQRRRYVVFSPDGQPAARVVLPSELNIYQIGRDYILGTWVDEATDVEYVRQYPLDRAADG